MKLYPSNVQQTEKDDVKVGVLGVLTALSLNAKAFEYCDCLPFSLSGDFIERSTVICRPLSLASSSSSSSSKARLVLSPSSHSSSPSSRSSSFSFRCKSSTSSIRSSKPKPKVPALLQGLYRGPNEVEEEPFVATVALTPQPLSAEPVDSCEEKRSGILMGLLVNVAATAAVAVAVAVAFVKKCAILSFIKKLCHIFVEIFTARKN
uniref:Uncharacterized protein n=1 Tax=Glossina austeni TaxID=7395 RepID=A0A1A9ULD8_GLOAU